LLEGTDNIFKKNVFINIGDEEIKALSEGTDSTQLVPPSGLIFP
jgi:hypothetical protein